MNLHSLMLAVPLPTFSGSAPPAPGGGGTPGPPPPGGDGKSMVVVAVSDCCLVAVVRYGTSGGLARRYLLICGGVAEAK